MVSISQFSIRNSTATLNISKGGSTSLYVDKNYPTADDYNDGFSWDRPFKTINGALSTAGPWTEIYIKSGVYDENVIIPHENTILHGLVQDGIAKVSIQPSGGIPLVCSYGHCEFHGIEFVSSNADGIYVTGNDVKIHDCDFHILSSGLSSHACVAIHGGNYALIYSCSLDGANYPNVIGVLVDSGSIDAGILGNYFTGFGYGDSAGYAIAIHDAQRVAIVPRMLDGRMMPNRFYHNYVGVYFYTEVGYRGHSVHGCGFWDTTYYDVYDPNVPADSGIVIDGNFYGYAGWFTDDNHDGMADLLVDCYSNGDYHPLSSLQSLRIHPITKVTLP